MANKAHRKSCGRLINLSYVPYGLCFMCLSCQFINLQLISFSFLKNRQTYKYTFRLHTQELEGTSFFKTTGSNYYIESDICSKCPYIPTQLIFSRYNLTTQFIFNRHPFSDTQSSFIFCRYNGTAYFTFTRCGTLYRKHL